MSWLHALKRSATADDLDQLVRDTVEECAVAGLRLIPIVAGASSAKVTELLSRGELGGATELVPAIAWVPAQPLYG